MKKLLLVVLLLLPGPLFAQTTTFLESGTDATFDLKFFAATSGTVTSDSTQSKTGPRAIKTDTGAGSTAAYAETTATSILLDTGSQISFWYRFATLPAAANSFFSVRQAAGGVMAVRMTTTGAVNITPVGGTASADSSTLLAVDTWYRITLSYYITSTVTYQMKLYVNGGLEATANAGTLSRTTATFLRFQTDAAAGANRVAWFDDIYVATGGASSSSQPDTGDVRVTAKRPIANGTTNGFTTEVGAGPAPNGVGTGHAPNVSERALSATYGWSIVAAGVTTEEYNIQSVSAGDVDLTGRTLVSYAGWVYGEALISETASIKVNGASSNITLAGVALLQKQIASTTYPAGTGTDIGVVTDATATTVSLYEAGIIFAFRPSASCRRALLGVGTC